MHVTKRLRTKLIVSVQKQDPNAQKAKKNATFNRVTQNVLQIFWVTTGRSVA